MVERTRNAGRREATPMRGLFKDRRHAGRQLATRLRKYAGRPDVLVLGLARGGVPVASEVARLLDLPLDVFVVRKIATPAHPELALGSIATGGVCVLDREAIRARRLSAATVERMRSEGHVELERREDAYRELRPTPDVRGRTVVLVDDRLLSGGGIFPAVAALRDEGPATIVVATPVAEPNALATMRRVADDCVCVVVAADARDVGARYVSFAPTSDEEVRTLLDNAAWRRGDDGRRAVRAPVREALAPPV